LRIFAVDTASHTASCALAENGKIICELFADCGRTHSHTLMSMAETLYNIAGITVDCTDVFAVTAGPGSFTGLRIGIAAVKGMAQASGKPCVAVSTLEALAMNTYPIDYISACVLDARNGCAYAASFRITGDSIERLSADEAIAYGVFAGQLKQNHPDEKILVFGDGADLLIDAAKRDNLLILKAFESAQHPKASGIARRLSDGRHSLELLAPDDVSPVYLRVPQAVRSLQNKGGKPS